MCLNFLIVDDQFYRYKMQQKQQLKNKLRLNRYEN